MTHWHVYKNSRVSFHGSTTIGRIFHFLRPVFNFVSHKDHIFLHYTIIPHIASWNLHLYISQVLKQSWATLLEVSNISTVFKCLRFIKIKLCFVKLFLRLLNVKIEKTMPISDLFLFSPPSQATLIGIHIQTHLHTHTLKTTSYFSTKALI